MNEGVWRSNSGKTKCAFIPGDGRDDGGSKTETVGRRQTTNSLVGRGHSVAHRSGTTDINDNVSDGHGSSSSKRDSVGGDSGGSTADVPRGGSTTIIQNVSIPSESRCEPEGVTGG